MKKQYWTKEMKAEYMKKYRQENRERLDAYQATYNRSEQRKAKNAERKRILRLDPVWRENARRLAREKYKKHGAAIREKERLRRLADPVKYNLRQRFLKHGVTPEDVQRMRDTQNDACAICLKPLGEFRGNRGPHIDHCHKTGLIRGILCSNCNLGLGNFHDCIDDLLRAIEYLKKNS